MVGIVPKEDRGMARGRGVPNWPVIVAGGKERLHNPLAGQGGMAGPGLTPHRQLNNIKNLCPENWMQYIIYWRSAKGLGDLMLSKDQNFLWISNILGAYSGRGNPLVLLARFS